MDRIDHQRGPGLPLPGVDLDFRRFRELEGRGGSLRPFKFSLLILAALLLWLGYGATPMLVWGLAYPLVLWGHVWLVERLPDQGPRRLLIAPLLSLLVLSAVYMVPGLYFWTWDSPVFKLYSLLFLVFAALDTLSHRSHLRLLMAIDLTVIFLGVALRIGWLWWMHPPGIDTLGVSVALLGAFAYFAKVVMEIAGTREALQNSLRNEIESARRRALTQISGGVAHDFNNLLTAVLGNMELARLTETEGEREALMGEAEKAARRGAELTGRLLALSSKARLSPVSVSPERVGSNVQSMAGSILGSGHRLHLSMAAGLPSVFVDMGKLQTALLELVNNGADAMPSGGNLRLTLSRSREFDGRGVCFELSDEGVGIPEELQEQVFEPYFSTKPAGRGSGLGLSMVQGFVRQSGGQIRMISVPGQGTRVAIHLPAEAPAAP